MVDATVTLYKDIGLDANYARSMDFTSKAEQNTWFNSIASNLKTTLTNVNYNKVQNALYIHEQFGDVLSYTYARLQEIDDSGRTYYFFISNVVLVDDETTRFDLVMDPIQTFMTEWELGPCLVNREHCDRWANGNVSRLSPLKEGFEGNAEVEEDEGYIDYPVSQSDPTVEIMNFPYSTLIVIFSKDIYYNKEEGNESESFTQVFYGVVPISHTDNTFTQDVVVNGSMSTVTIESITSQDVIDGSWFDKLGINTDSIFGAYIANQFALRYYGSVSGTNCNGAYNKNNLSLNITSVHLGETGLDLVYNRDYPVEFVAWSRSTSKATNSVYLGLQVLTENEILKAFNSPKSITYSVPVPTAPDDGDTASDTHEPALYMTPFRYSYVTDSAYTPLMNIPDIIKLAPGTSKLRISTLLKSTGLSNCISTEEVENGVIGGSTMVPVNTLDVLSDSWRNYCLTQRDSDRRMMWSNILSNTINQAVFMGYGGALVGSRSNSGKNDPMKNANAVDVPGYGGTMARAMGFGLGASLITSAVSGYDMWIQQEAKEQKLRNQPSTLTAQSDGVAMGMSPIRVVSTKMDDVNYNIAYEKFLHYGYVVNAMETPNIRSRKYYNYICTGNTVIKGALPANIKQALVNIFENGITLFHADYCDDTNYPTNSTGEELENIERSLL